MIVENEFFLVATERSQNVVNVHLSYKPKRLSGHLQIFTKYIETSDEIRNNL